MLAFLNFLSLSPEIVLSRTYGFSLCFPFGTHHFCGNQNQMWHITPTPALSSWSTTDYFMNLVGSVDVLKCQFNVILLLQRRLLLIHLQFLKCDFLILFSCIGGVNLSCLILELPNCFPLLNFAIFFSDFISQLFSVLSCPVLAILSSFVSSSDLIKLLSSQYLGC